MPMTRPYRFSSTGQFMSKRRKRAGRMAKSALLGGGVGFGILGSKRGRQMLGRLATSSRKAGATRRAGATIGALRLTKGLRPAAFRHAGRAMTYLRGLRRAV